MASNETHNPSDGARRPSPVFLTTHWSVVLAAAQSDTPRARDALGCLCQAYWYPLYAYVRRRGQMPEDAKDLVQEFFARMLKGNWIAQANPQRGRFRAFLLAAMKHFLANEWHKVRAKKRGGGRILLSLNDDTAERSCQLEPADPATPESLFERRWALTLLEGVLDRLAEEYRRAGKRAWFDALQPALTLDHGAIPYAAMANELGLTEGAVRVAAHRLRQRYRHLVRAEVANTVASPAEVEEEMRHLFQVLSRR